MIGINFKNESIWSTNCCCWTVMIHWKPLTKSYFGMVAFDPVSIEIQNSNKIFHAKKRKTERNIVILSSLVDCISELPYKFSIISKWEFFLNFPLFFDASQYFSIFSFFSDFSRKIHHSQLSFESASLHSHCFPIRKVYILFLAYISPASYINIIKWNCIEIFL